jgi:hypothetical protein
MFLVVALASLLVVSGGIYAYTYTSSLGNIGIATPAGDFATVTASSGQPDWEEMVDSEYDTETFRPNATGTYSQCDAIGDSPNYACVDEATSDEDATYVRTFGWATELDTHNIPDHSQGAGNVTELTVYIRSRGSTPDTHAAEAAIRTSGTNYYGGYTAALPSSYGYISANWTTNPYTTDRWTWAEIDALEIGLRQYDMGSGGPYTTQVYALVDYEYLPTADSVPTGDLFEINEDANYDGDLNVRVYLTNAADLLKAFESLEMRLYLEDSEEAGQTPNYQLLTLENGVASFTLKDPVSDNHTLSVTGGNYVLVSDNMSQWETGWTATPELFCEATQR